ncbi:MAG TPA: biotin--[acetyl-CoA-carboxylase] ligase [Ktedonobacteraceae bacterium]|nr:biotin--[acetyl-CoA-carboxylase] ligase [Ktedonobacteraceae bacterium]
MDEKEIARFGRLDLEALRAQLSTLIFGKGQRLIYLPSVTSTNTYAMQLAQKGSEEGVVVLTDSQTAGKGRLGRTWVDATAHNALSSTVLRPRFPLYLLVMAASLAVVDAIASSSSVDATIKWPNDVLIGERKVAGILIETSHDQNGQLVAIVGIGVNVNGQRTAIFETGETAQTQADSGPGTLAAKATTLETEAGHVVSRETFIAHLLQRLETYYLQLQQETQEPVAPDYGSASRLIREQWRNQLSTLGRTIQVRQGNTILSGVAENVNDEGELFLRSHSGERVKITWGDIGYPTE